MTSEWPDSPCSEYFGRPEADVEGVVSFYAQFKRVKPGRFQISVCDGTACHLKGAPLIHEWLHQELGLKPGETAPDGLLKKDGASRPFSAVYQKG